ncbi:cupin domain-containing protein [Porticoccus sp. W117]|uniref:cupin domain-containing protein n=1 Tax=Porticoccus sp. W117 TaxID=3054777 RepID=UPI00259405D3|nr:cupin domain-containing protein [Porticoccus sp. W117]MDM3871928.1 cupin domain-containing protein [Porticoccus sp. W117]
MLTHLGTISIETFLRDYWQQKPLLVRNAFPDFESPLTPDELAGLALEEDVESRIVLENGSEGPWQLLNGPFEESAFSQLPETHWTLLVQAVDQWVPEAQEFLEQFKFLPSWRLDDLMVSYAPQGGSVGPHFDFYDVFLIQGHGQRRWQVGPKADDDSPRVANTKLRILKNFKVEHEWVLEPGDMLYLPPQYSHNGVALNDCLTYSVGFRAPSVGEIIDDLATDAISHHKDHQRYTDPGEPLANSGEISPAAIEGLKATLQKALLDEGLLRNWLGRYMTARKYPELDISQGADADWAEQLYSGALLQRHPASRFAYSQTGADSAQLFVDGEAVATSLSLAELLCGGDALDWQQLQNHLADKGGRNVLEQLVEYGALYLD